ncbi:hypothetical protein CDD83_8509 [Cordyceps sp. RAO-2017]|nr:hypothetical protein CDD83_8509 [Cordyceps sp. RAO-2017]
MTVQTTRTDSNAARQALVERHEDVRYPFAFKSIDWDEYHVFRPAYPPSMWDMWMSYHRSHGGRFEAAHDIGAGPGTAARALAHFFDHVYVSDAGKHNIATARQQLRPASRFSFSSSPAEAGWLADRTVDMACICMALHFMDAGAALRAAARRCGWRP